MDGRTERIEVECGGSGRRLGVPNQLTSLSSITITFWWYAENKLCFATQWSAYVSDLLLVLPLSHFESSSSSLHSCHIIMIWGGGAALAVVDVGGGGFVVVVVVVGRHPHLLLLLLRGTCSNSRKERERAWSNRPCRTGSFTGIVVVNIASIHVIRTTMAP